MQKGEQTTAYTYDGMGRLLTESEGNTATVYTYTQSGNRATKTVTADGETTQTITYAYDKNNRLKKEQSTQNGQTVVTGYTYDHNGNQIIKNAMVLSSEGGARSFALSENNNSTEFFTYDLRNRLTQYKTGDTKASYTYGADGFRDSKTVNGVLTSFIYDGVNIIETKQGETVTDYIRGIGLIKYTDSTTTAYYFTDDHGSTSSLYNATGTKIADYTYDAFGNEEQVSTDTNPFRYCGEYTDQESGLVYLRARYYDPQTGRFISEDTHWTVHNMIYGDKEYEEGETKLLDIAAIMQSGNLYVYCMNNPIVFMDSTGKVANWVILALYTYAQAIITSPDLQYDMQILAYDISQGDYVSAAFDVVDILAPGFSGSKMIPKFIRKYFDDVVNWLVGVKTKNIEDLISAKSLTSNHSKGARWIPNNLKESLAMETVLSNPSGKTILERNKMNDSRWLGSDGWVKKAQNVNGVEIHYNYNELTGEFDDFKFK